MDAMQILVIILSAFLALFLILAIVLVVMLIKVTRQIKRVTSTAQTAAERLSDMAGTVNKIASPALLAKLLASYVGKLKKPKHKRKSKED